jgi:hypothetical protein
MSEMRFFTPEEANATLPLLRPLVERLVAERRSLVATTADLRALGAVVGGNGGRIDSERAGRLQEEASRAAAELSGHVDEIEALGAQVKDLDAGLVDFPALHPESGKTVLLCWRLGESEVGNWHGLEDGFAGRKPLPF